MPAASSAPVLHAEAPDGALIAYRLHGEVASGDGPPPVLLVHGFASDSVVTWEGTGWVRALLDVLRDSTRALGSVSHGLRPG